MVPDFAADRIPSVWMQVLRVGMNWIEIGFSRPPQLVTASVQGTAVMGPAQRDGKFIADPPSERSRLHEPEVVGMGRPAADAQRLLTSLDDIARIRRLSVTGRSGAVTLARMAERAA
jgi:hypothetical protein